MPLALSRMTAPVADGVAEAVLGVGLAVVNGGAFDVAGGALGAGEHAAHIDRAPARSHRRIGLSIVPS
jgi:hypothetical protein